MPGLNPNSIAGRNSIQQALHAKERAENAAEQARTAGIRPQEDKKSPPSKGHNRTHGMEAISRPQPSYGTTNKTQQHLLTDVLGTVPPKPQKSSGVRGILKNGCQTLQKSDTINLNAQTQKNTRENAQSMKTGRKKR